MKKVFIIILFCFILTGCNNKYSIDFNDKIDTTIDFSFSSSEYKNQMNSTSKDIDPDVKAMISEMRPLTDSYDELFEEVKLNDSNYSYEGTYKYTYTYSNFVKNAMIERCFEYPVIEDDDKKIYVYLSGNSDCAPFELNVKADSRMLTNNAEIKKDGQYIWNVKKENNDIRFYISKEPVNNSIISTKNIIYIILGVITTVSIIIYSKKIKGK